MPLVLGAALVAGCGPRPVGPYKDAPVVLISIDTLRADHLPLYGYAKGATPNLDVLGREGVIFENVVSHCPLTLPAHASLFTGLLPPRHGVRDNIGFTLRSDHRTLATRFKQAGWTTGAAVSAFVVRAATGIGQGFDVYDDALEVDAANESLGAQQRDGAVAVESLARWVVAQGSGRFFAFLHLYEPHTPYAPPPEHRHFDQPYDGEIAYADDLVGRLVARFREKGILDRAVLAVTSDHGEGLGDHEEQEHGFFLYREAVQVPLLLRLPGAARGGTRITGVVAQVDIPATLLDLVGLVSGDMDGVSLRSAIDAGRSGARSVYSETFFPRYHYGWSELLSVTEERYRYIRAPRAELFDLAADPRERRNLAAERASTVTLMNAWLEKQFRVGEVAAPEEATAETREVLQALGYVGGGAPTGSAGPLADPKDKIGAYEAYKRALSLRREGRDSEALAELRKLLAREPEILDAWETLGLTLVRMGREVEGLAALAKLLDRDPTRASVHLELARLHALAGRRELAERHAEAASLRDPGRGFELLAEIMLTQDRLKEAAAYARRSIAADRERAMSHFVLATGARREGRCEDALPEFRAAIEAKQRQRRLVVRGLHAGLADCLARLGREPEAEREFLAEIEQIPFTREGRVGLSILYRSQGRDREARAALEGVVTANPRAGADEYWTVVRTLAGLGDVEAARAWAARARSRYPSDPRFR